MKSHKTITLYNRYIDKATDAVSYIRTVLECNHWEESQGKTASTAAGANQSGADTCTIFIPHVQNCTSRTFCTPEEYTAMKRADREQHYTFAPEDIIYPGICTTELKAFSGKIRGYLRVLKYDNLNFGSARMHHFEVLCKE